MICYKGHSSILLYVSTAVLNIRKVLLYMSRCRAYDIYVFDLNIALGCSYTFWWQYISVCSPVCLWQPGIYCLAHFHLQAPLLSSSLSRPSPIYFPFIVHIFFIILPTFSPCLKIYCLVHLFIQVPLLALFSSHLQILHLYSHIKPCFAEPTSPTKYLFIDCRVKHFLAGA